MCYLIIRLKHTYILSGELWSTNVYHLCWNDHRSSQPAETNNMNWIICTMAYWLHSAVLQRNKSTRNLTSCDHEVSAPNVNPVKTHWWQTIPSRYVYLSCLCSKVFQINKNTLIQTTDKSVCALRPASLNSDFLCRYGHFLKVGR